MFKRLIWLLIPSTTFARLTSTSFGYVSVPQDHQAIPTLSHSAEHATHTGCHKRTRTFEMRSGSKRMHTWRRTPSTGRNFQTL